MAFGGKVIKIWWGEPVGGGPGEGDEHIFGWWRDSPIPSSRENPMASGNEVAPMGKKHVSKLLTINFASK